MSSKMLSVTKQLHIIFKERFNPLLSVLFIATFVIANYKASYLLTNAQNTSPITLFFIYCAVLLFFFMLRLHDEIKDYEFDKIHHPERPLPRHAVQRKDLITGIYSIIIIQYIILFIFAPQGILWFSICLLYTIFMYNEFFIGKWLKKRIVLYAITHTAVIILLSITLFTIFSTNISFTTPTFYLFILSNWFAFSIFEFSRKVYTQKDERTSTDSYSKALTPIGAVALNIITMLLAYILLDHVIQLNLFLLLYITFVATLGILYTYVSTTKTVRLFQLTASMYIPLFYITIILMTT